MFLAIVTYCLYCTDKRGLCAPILKTGKIFSLFFLSLAVGQILVQNKMGTQSSSQI